MNIRRFAAPAVAAIAIGCAAHTGPLRVGEAPPDVVSRDHNGQPLRLRDLRGKATVVFFYAQDADPAAVDQARAFQAIFRKFKDLDAKIVGVSPDGVTSHHELHEAENLRFTLIPDTDLKVATAFGVPLENGRPKRSTYLLDRHQSVRKIWTTIGDPNAHAAEVLAAVQRVVSAYSNDD